MKVHFFPASVGALRARSKPCWEILCRAVCCLAALGCGGLALGQTNNPAADVTKSDSSSSTNVIKLAPTDVFGRLDVARNQILPDLGATVYGISKEQIAALPQGENASFNEVLLRAPGMAQDSAA